MFVQINPLVAKLITHQLWGMGGRGRGRRRKGERERREREGALLYCMTVGEESIQSKEEGLISVRSDFNHFAYGLKS